MNILQQNRIRADRKFRTLVRPTKKNENYRYTQIAESLKYEAEAEKPLPNLLFEGDGVVVVVRSENDRLQILKGEIENKFILEELKNLSDHLELSHLDLSGSLESDFFANEIISNKSTAIGMIVPDNTKIEEPIRIVHFFNEKTRCFPHRLVIVLGKNSSARITEHFVSAGENAAATSSGLTQITVKDAGQLKYTRINEFSDETQFSHRISFDIMKDASVHAADVSFGGKTGQTRVQGTLREPGAEFFLSGTARARKEQNLDYWLESIHLASNTNAHMEYCSIAEDEATVVFDGNIHIKKGSMNVDASQKNKNLVLSPRANVYSIPKLEIAADDVSCAHGTSIAPIDEDQVFYLESRGICRSDARALIINGFNSSVLAKIEIEGLRKAIYRKNAKKREQI